MKQSFGACPMRPHPILVAIAAAFAATSVSAATIDMGDSDVRVRWDNTVKYGTMYRLNNPSAGLLADPNGDDGNRNFKKGFVSNRIDLLSEFDVSTRSYGFRASAAAWYDQSYKSDTDNDGRGFYNSLSTPFNQFPGKTERIHGQDAEVLDLFAWGKTSVGGMPLTARLGRHTVIFGEAIFPGFTVADAQGPVDVVKATSSPGSQLKEILRPVEQISANLRFNETLSMDAYYQFKWRGNRLPETGSYFSFQDIANSGSESIVTPPPPAGFGLAPRGPDRSAKDSGQGGVQFRIKPQDSLTEYGLFAAQFNDRSNTFAFDLSGLLVGQPAQLRHFYQNGIKVFGGSFNRALEGVSLAGEASIRTGQPLNSNPVAFGAPLPGVAATAQPALGRTAHALVNAIYVMPRNNLFPDGATVIGELSWHRLMSVTSDPNNSLALRGGPRTDGASFATTRSASKITLVFQPTYYQVIDGLDIDVPVVLNYGLSGRSQIAPAAIGWSKGVGDISIGVNGTYLNAWKFGLNYTKYLGSEGGAGSFGQPWKDRDFVSFNIRRTF